METVTDYFGGLQNHYRWCMQPRNKKKHLLLGRKAMTNLDSILKSRDITLLTKVCLVKAMAFPVVMYGCESLTIKKAEHRRIDAFELWCWRRLLRVPCTGMETQPVHPKGNQSWIFTLATWCEELTHWKRPWCWEKLKVGGEGDDRGWDGITDLVDMSLSKLWELVVVREALACCSPWGRKNSDKTEWLNSMRY